MFFQKTILSLAQLSLHLLDVATLSVESAL
jgi:hypothetical protein